MVVFSLLALLDLALVEDLFFFPSFYCDVWFHCAMTNLQVLPCMPHTTKVCTRLNLAKKISLLTGGALVVFTYEKLA